MIEKKQFPLTESSTTKSANMFVVKNREGGGILKPNSRRITVFLCQIRIKINLFRNKCLKLLGRVDGKNGQNMTPQQEGEIYLTEIKRTKLKVIKC